MPETGVLVMAYGSPEHPDELEAYYTDIRRGRPPTPEQLADLRRRYDAIGGLSPLAERTRAQVEALRRRLDEQAPGRWRVVLGLKHAAPRIEDAVARLLEAGVGEAVALVLAPHYSRLSVGQYLERASAGGHLAVRPVPAWHRHPTLVRLLAGRVREAAARFPGGVRPALVVTAHSLPERVLAMEQPTYRDRLHETAAAVAAAAGVGRWRIAFQSAGRTPEPWLGPDLADELRRLGAAGAAGVVVCPAGFTSEHLEVLYDLDIEARAVAEAAGMHLERTAALDADETFVDLLAELVVAGAARPAIAPGSAR